jgi:hypothetical protein
VREISTLMVDRTASAEERVYVSTAKRRLVLKMVETVGDVKKSLDVYDGYYAGLVHRGQPQLFRDFLLQAPHMFVELGEKLGGLAHIASFWRFRFPSRQVQPVDPEIVLSLFTDFMLSIGLTADESNYGRV